MQLSETIEGVYVSAYFKSQTFIYLHSLSATGSVSWNPDVQNTQFEPYSHFRKFQGLVTNFQRRYMSKI